MAAKKVLIRALLALIIIMALIQLVPYGRDLDNPAVTGTPNWDSPETKALFDRACADCHSNGTKWPWYAHVAPVSWLVYHDVEEGREHFNVSEWGRPEKNEGYEAAEEVEEGEMPLKKYLITHPEAKLSEAETQQLIKGLTATFGTEQSEHENGGHEE